MAGRCWPVTPLPVAACRSPEGEEGGAVAYAPADLTVSATASDPDGQIAKVEFYQGDTLIGSATQTPFAYTWSAVPAGSYSLTAKATDDKGATTSSAPVSISVTAGMAHGIFYIHPDHLGTPRAVTDDTDRVVWQNPILGDPFGASQPDEDPDGDGRKFELNLRFPGQYYDKESGLHYNYFRDYDPSTGRYVQADPIGLNGGLNVYGYVGGSPLRLIDPIGLDASVSVNGNNVTITVPITYSGPGATSQVTQGWNSAIESTWSGQFGSYNVTTRVTNGPDNQITVPTGDGRAYVNGVGGNSGAWPSERPGWTAAHEAGHLMGLDDHYDSKGPKPGWENDIMGGRDKSPSARDIADIINTNNGNRNRRKEPEGPCN